MALRVVGSSILSRKQQHQAPPLQYCVQSSKAKACAQNESLVLLQFLLLALYLILLSVLYLIQLGIGLFCLIFLASLTFFLNVLIDP